MSRRSAKLKPLCAALLVALASPALSMAGENADVAGVPATPGDAMDNKQVLGKVEVNASTTNYDNETTTIGKLPTAVKDLPQTVNVINRALLDAQGATSLADALRNVPGITIGGAEGGQIGNNINLRGFTARTDIYLDGFRDRGQYYRDTFELESIEVLKGPSSMLFGRGSTGGVINQVSKQPTAARPRRSHRDDRHRRPLRVTADLNQPLSDTSAFRVNVFAQDNHSTRDVMYEQGRRHRADPALRHRHADRDHAVGAAAAQSRHARLRPAAGQRQARAGRPRQLLRPHRRPHDPGRRDVRRAHRAQLQRRPDAQGSAAVQRLQDRRARNRAEQSRHRRPACRSTARRATTPTRRSTRSSCSSRATTA